MHTQNNKLYKCYKEGCSFRFDHPEGEFLSQSEFDEYSKDGKIYCPEGNFNCGLQELRPEDYPKPPKPPINLMLILISVISVVFAVALIMLINNLLDGGDGESEIKKRIETEVELETEMEPIEPVIPEKDEETVIVDTEPEGTATLQFSGKIYKGEVLDGRPHGLGTLEFKKRTIISEKDPAKREAEAGDYVTGTFHKGYLYQGKHFDRNNRLKDVISIGKGGNE